MQAEAEARAAALAQAQAQVSPLNPLSPLIPLRPSISLCCIINRASLTIDPPAVLSFKPKLKPKPRRPWQQLMSLVTPQQRPLPNSATRYRTKHPNQVKWLFLSPSSSFSLSLSHSLSLSLPASISLPPSLLPPLFRSLIHSPLRLAHTLFV